MIPFNNYYIDSAKFYIDTHILDRVNIPEDFILMDSNTGNILDEFKKHSINIPYKNHKIYLAKEIKIIPGRKAYEKVMFYFPAKISPETYFYGITKEMIFEVLNYIMSLGYIDFEDINKVFDNIEVKDLDIKIDHKFEWSYKETLVKYNKVLQERFNGDSSQFRIFNSKKDGLGIMTYNRNYTTISKPFLKFYNKSDEILIGKNKETLFDLMPLEVQKICNENLIYRYEFTIKTLDFFKHFNISNRISDILLIEQSKWKEIGKYYLDKNFQQKIKAPLDRSKLTPQEKAMSLMIYDLIQLGRSINQIKMFFRTSTNRTQRMRDLKTFERCYYFASVPNKETDNLIMIYNEMIRLDIIFGF